ncbi:shikimate dehydrogenase [Nocardioides sp. SYSU D00065]|uniref:shikimate dehydrogenase family protein n=1 Tax=Nocardioides sp. SYSU D00065 TaxID=2817378 RepID=UPI001B341196|nr:hypothetical protein [Nocardioides sp. SYSU D00065]
MGFVGVTTGSSSIMEVFPRWAVALGLPTTRLVGHDVLPGSPGAVYHDLVSGIAKDPQHHGALVTTHKIAVYDHCRDLFDELDALATTFGEVSSIAKRDGRLVGAAKDPVTVRLALEEFLAPDHFATGGAALVLGSGGAGCALTYTLGTRQDLPEQIICTAIDEKSLRHHRALHERGGLDTARIRYVLTRGPDEVDALLRALPERSLVVNATGMGKDLPGSPLGPDALFPRRGVVWEFNYRGSLELLHQAEAQRDVRDLEVIDGWRYFIHGWTQVIADVFQVPMTPEVLDNLSALAGRGR